MIDMIPIDLDIDMLRCFKAVAETGSFTRAGNTIGLTQSGVSLKIRRLEERLSAKVFKRTSKNLSFTLEGEMLLDYANRILSVHDEAVGRLTKPKVSGLLRIGLMDYCLPELLPDLLIQFRKQYPNIHLEVQIDVGTTLIPLFEKGDLDLVVAGKDDYQGSNRVRSRVLIQEPLIWVIGEGTEISFDETLNLVLFPAPCNFRKIAIESLEKENRKWESLFTGTSSAGIQTAVKSGMGL
ncbi:LysR family transcriptional regulator, partial [Desulfobacterales bacterium HSG16]|nr:LysR family transcriptional regulator [Desulfobacterales bacterium HSG16]